MQNDDESLQLTRDEQRLACALREHLPAEVGKLLTVAFVQKIAKTLDDLQCLDWADEKYRSRLADEDFLGKLE